MVVWHGMAAMLIDSLTFRLADTGETIIYYHRHIILLYAIFIIMHIIIYIWTSIFYKKNRMQCAHSGQKLAKTI